MKLKSKAIGFYPDNNMFVGVTKKTDTMGVITFGDDNKHTKEARQRTDKILENDEGYLLLQEMGKRDNVDIQYQKAHKAKTDIWTILFHKFLIEALEQDGYAVLKAPRWEQAWTDNAIVIE